MPKTILITGATDGIGKLTAERLIAAGHHVLLHGRNADKLAAVASELGGQTESYVADLSRFSDVQAMADQVKERHDTLDVLINNAGVLKSPNPTTADGLDLRFVVNTLAPYVLTQRLLPILGKSGRVVNLSSAAQARVNLDAMAGKTRLEDMPAYSQSKLAITIWTQELAKTLPDGPSIVSVNPGSLLGTKMVKEGFGMAGKDVGIGAGILVEAALGDSFIGRSGQYYDNDSQRFASPHTAALDASHATQVMQAIEALVASKAGPGQNS